MIAISRTDDTVDGCDMKLIKLRTFFKRFGTEVVALMFDFFLKKNSHAIHFNEVN